MKEFFRIFAMNMLRKHFIGLQVRHLVAVLIILMMKQEGMFIFGKYGMAEYLLKNTENTNSVFALNMALKAILLLKP